MIRRDEDRGELLLHEDGLFGRHSAEGFGKLLNLASHIPMGIGFSTEQEGPDPGKLADIATGM